MRAVVQRVSRSSVVVEGQTVGAIGAGVMILLGVTHDDGPEQARWLANKIAGLRILEDDEGKMNRGLLDIGGAALVISQFTLYGDCRKGRRPSFTHAARPELAEPLCEQFMQFLREAGVTRVEYGVFGAHMDVEIHNDGPVTLILERE